MRKNRRGLTTSKTEGRGRQRKINRRLRTILQTPGHNQNHLTRCRESKNNTTIEEITDGTPWKRQPKSTFRTEEGDSLTNVEMNGL